MHRPLSQCGDCRSYNRRGLERNGINTYPIITGVSAGAENVKRSIPAATDSQNEAERRRREPSRR